jgi:hypothetical protein
MLQLVENIKAQYEIPTLEDLMPPLWNDHANHAAKNNNSILGLSLETIEFIVQSAIAKRNSNSNINSNRRLNEQEGF